ncbi:hypothetical protein SOVF_141410 [Spinacia oleracea]|uniref:F-box/kelch-repeat protein At3g06240 n=1 Tax=Spinacia oleracea TaxID=3562 RepID=A0A9R0HVE7_SPIOL|nr:F-box/kelch-repeat protein At3g06240-like [Spinacia oleracea]KNA10756.1 hypothetical protein SOVF_141410 [Spinacia oleracea]
MATVLPPEIETEILLCLPAKSLQRFTAVCRLWHSVITSSTFIATFNHRASLHPQLLLLKHPYPHLHRLLSPSLTTIHFSLSSDSFLELTSLKVPHKSHHPVDDDDDNDRMRPTRVELVTSNSINGILCVLVHKGLSEGMVIDCDLFLWNPSTSESLKVPSSTITGLFSGPPMVKFYCGFGFGDGDYKVIRVLDSVQLIAEVYSLRENCWRKISGSDISSNILWASSTCTFVDGVGYWGAYRRERKDKFFVLGFDFETERFEKIKTPIECVDGDEMRYHSLWVYRGMLAISVLRFGEFESRVTRHYIWVMMGDEGLDDKHKNWCRLFNIDLEGGPRKPMATLGNGEVLLLGEDDGEHALYDPESEQVRRVDVFDVDAVASYVESLVSFGMLIGTAEVAVSLD